MERGTLTQRRLVDQYGNAIQSPEKPKNSRVLQLTKNNWPDPNSYDLDTSFRKWDGQDPMGVHTTGEMLEALHKDQRLELDARIYGVQNSKMVAKKMGRQPFLEAFKKDTGKNIKFRESDAFATDGYQFSSVGNDFTPLLGGPFYKQLYYYNDYIRMHAEAFYAFNHDPFARAITQITRDFVLGTGYEVQCDTSSQEGKMAMVAWKCFEEANNLQEQLDQACNEISIYGEIMFWQLPDHETKIVYDLPMGDTPPRGVIPRVRLIDPSNIVEIVTYPEDITRPLFYVWLTPTQYQIFTSGLGSDSPNSKPDQPTIKFIYQQIPAEQMMHYKINSVSNEKRGRSDYFPIFSYLKRLRDSVNYSIIALQKVAAYSIDTTVDGDQTDIDAYVRAQAALGTIPPAGSEFVHSTKITRTYNGISAGNAGTSNAFDWCLSMIASGSGIPISYFATHLSGGQTRASALVATEPVAKKMEKRREVMKRILKKFWSLTMKKAGLPNVDCDIVFPELITQDRSQKLKDLLLMQQSRWIKPERAASIAAKEMGIQNFNYQQELNEMDLQLPEIPMPLSDPGKISKTGKMQLPDGEEEVTGLTSNDKKDIKDEDRTL